MLWAGQQPPHSLALKVSRSKLENFASFVFGFVLGLDRLSHWLLPQEHASQIFILSELQKG